MIFSSRGRTQSEQVVISPSARKEIFRLEEFLICENAECRFLTSLRQGEDLLPREDLIFSVCPKCDHEWSGRCPFCVQTLEVVWRGNAPCCSYCGRELLPEAHID